MVGAYQRKLEEIAAREVDLTVLVPPGWQDARLTLTLERAYTKGYRLEVEPTRFNGHFHWYYHPQLAVRIAREKPDLLHIDEEPYNFATWQALRLAQRAGIPALFFTWQNLPRRYPPPFAWMERAVLRRAAYAIAGTQQAADVWRDKGYGGPLAVIPQFGVDPEIFKPGPPRETGPFRIGYAGRLVPEKGVDVLLNALAGLAGDWHLSLAAQGPERDNLQKLAARLQILPRVTFEQAMPSTTMPDYYRTLDALILPSLTRPNWKEQFGRVLIEALACGVPVVGSESGAIPEVLGDVGLTFPEGDAQALRQRLDSLMRRDASQRAAAAQQGRDAVLARFTQAQVAEQTVAVYCDVVGR